MKKYLLWSIPFVIVVLAATGYFLFNNRNTEEPLLAEQETGAGMDTKPTLGAALIYTEGAVEYKTGNDGWKRATTDVNLSEGDAVEVVGEGKAIIAIDDGSVVRIGNDSGVTLAAMNPNHIIISNDKGNVYTRVIESNRIFEVATNDANYESLGTGYETVNTETKNGVKVYHSKVKVKDKDGNEKTVVEEGKKYFVKNEDDESLEDTKVAMQLDEMRKDDFLAWNAEEDEKQFNNELGKLGDMLSSVETISLTYLGGGKVSWTVEGDSPKGYKLVWSKASDPTYPLRDGDRYEYFSDPETRSGAIKAFDGDGTYHIRVCEYLGGSCGVYSNEVQATFDNAPDEEKETAKESEPKQTNGIASISVSHYGSGKVTWSVNGYSAQGFKVVWSKDNAPTYPTRSGDKYIYKSSPDSRSAVLSPFDGSGTYHVRVCEYLGGKCGVYSNEITVELTSEKETAKVPTGSVTSISLSATGNGDISWTTNGFSDMGFKVVWSKDSAPTYPCREGDQYHYLSSPETTSDHLKAFDGEGTYHVRVCEYLGGKCGTYSNEITVDL